MVVGVLYLSGGVVILEVGIDNNFDGSDDLGVGGGSGVDSCWWWWRWSPEVVIMAVIIELEIGVIILE